MRACIRGLQITLKYGVVRAKFLAESTNDRTCGRRAALASGNTCRSTLSLGVRPQNRPYISNDEVVQLQPQLEDSYLRERPFGFRRSAEKNSSRCNCRPSAALPGHARKIPAAASLHVIIDLAVHRFLRVAPSLPKLEAVRAAYGQFS